MRDTVVLDIETLGSVNNSVILSVGMVTVDSDHDYTFKELIEDGYYAKLDVKGQVDSGRKIHKDTVDWWSEQGEEAKHVLKPLASDMPWPELLPDMIRWLTKKGVDIHKVRAYSRGSHFDFGILHDLFRITGNASADALPWRFWNIHDSKTVVLTLLDKDSWQLGVEPEGFIHHNALHDAAREYLNMETAVYIFQNNLDNREPF